MTMEIATPVTFAQEVTDKVRKLIMDALPEEKVQEVLRKEFDLYFSDKCDRWGNKEKSQFNRLIEQEIKKQVELLVHTNVHNYLSNFIFADKASEHAKLVLAEITPVVLQAMSQQAAIDVASSFVLGIKQSLQNKY